jgi:phage terminase small subunit
MPILKNIRHERFAQGLAKGMIQDAAYEAAGYKPDRGNATRLTAHDSIRARVAEIQARAAERTEVTVASLTKQLIEDRDFARSLDNAAAAVTASAAIMKLHGLGSEKVKVETQSVVDYLTDLSRQDITVEAPAAADAIADWPAYTAAEQ